MTEIYYVNEKGDKVPVIPIQQQLEKIIEMLKELLDGKNSR
jgi:hypothetical protein